MHKRGLCRHAVSLCPSVRLSVKTNKHVFEIFLPSGNHTILFFRTKRGGDIPTVTPLTGASNAGGPGGRGIGRNGDSGLTAGYRRLLDVQSAKNIYR